MNAMVTEQTKKSSCSEQLREVQYSIKELMDRAPKITGDGRGELIVGERDLSTLLAKVERVYSSTRDIEYAFCVQTVTSTSRSPSGGKKAFDEGTTRGLHLDSKGIAENYSVARATKLRRTVIHLTKPYRGDEPVRVGNADPVAYRIACRLLGKGETVEKVARKLLLPLEQVKKLEAILKARSETGGEKISSDLNLNPSQLAIPEVLNAPVIIERECVLL